MQALVEFFSGVGRFDFVQLAVDFFIRRQEAKLLGALHEDFGFDQFIENAEAEALSLLADRLLIRAGGLVGVVLIDFAAIDLPSIDRCHQVAATPVAVARGERDQKQRASQEEARLREAFTICQFSLRHMSVTMTTIQAGKHELPEIRELSERCQLTSSARPRVVLFHRVRLACGMEAKRLLALMRHRVLCGPHPRARRRRFSVR